MLSYTPLKVSTTGSSEVPFRGCTQREFGAECYRFRDSGWVEKVTTVEEPRGSSNGDDRRLVHREVVFRWGKRDDQAAVAEDREEGLPENWMNDRVTSGVNPDEVWVAFASEQGPHDAAEFLCI